MACAAGAPRLEDRHQLAHVELPDHSARLYYSGLERHDAEGLLPEVAAVQSEVTGCLGFKPPRAELVLYPAPEGPSLEAVHETRCDLVRGEQGEWSIVFAYPYARDPYPQGPNPRGRAQLLGTTSHELAEATVLLRVTVLDPYLRWMHDGIAELVEHRVLSRRLPEAARSGLARARAFLEERLGAGDLWVDLSRWRQLTPWIVRSHRFLGPNQSNLSLDDLEGALRRVRRARDLGGEPDLIAGLTELEAMLLRAQALAERPYVPGEARAGDAETHDFLLYASSFALWLEVEQRRPGAARALLERLERRRGEGDHVLGAAEGEALLREVCPSETPPLTRYPLERAVAALRAEEERAGR
ncbi:MAG: hypothetical protein AB7N76_04680 [Planctomycetota bacterium]